MLALPPPSQVAPGNTGFSSQVAPGSQLPDCCRSWLELQTLKPISFLKHFCTLCATLCAGPLISQDLDRRAGSKRAHKGCVCAQPYALGTDFQGFKSWSGFQTSSKKGGGVRSPMRGTPFSQDLDRGDGFKKDTTQNIFSHA